MSANPCARGCKRIRIAANIYNATACSFASRAGSLGANFGVIGNGITAALLMANPSSGTGACAALDRPRDALQQAQRGKFVPSSYGVLDREPLPLHFERFIDHGRAYPSKASEGVRTAATGRFFTTLLARDCSFESYSK